MYLCSFIARRAGLSAIHHLPPGSCRRLAQTGSTWPTPSPRDLNKTSMAWLKGRLAAKVPWLDGGHHTAIIDHLPGENEGNKGGGCGRFRMIPR